MRTGKASLEFRGVAGDVRLARLATWPCASWAASAQRHGWDFLQLAYLRSLEAALPGTAPDAPAKLAGALGLDAERLGTDAARPEWQTQIRAAANVAGVSADVDVPGVPRPRPREAGRARSSILTRPGSVGLVRDAVAKARKTGRLTPSRHSTVEFCRPFG